MSLAGTVKLTTFSGVIFNHKDDKKGQHDTFCVFFIEHLGYPLQFPDTSNTWYQSHCDAAAVLIVYLPLFLWFLELVRDKKESSLFNHMENNVYKALQNTLTITKLCVLVLYAQAIPQPYMCQF